ncbi:MAG TPA: hypothetical protein VLT57_20235 [Bryobacteraceae bacterium]|nr:hypothetical protein [Bryobacteraceae bacterium]
MTNDAWNPYDGKEPNRVAELRARPIQPPEPPACYPLPEKPWPDEENWILVWWNGKVWCVGTARTDYAEAVEKLQQLRERNTLQWRMVKQTSTYTATND